MNSGSSPAFDKGHTVSMDVRVESRPRSKVLASRASEGWPSHRQSQAPGLCRTMAVGRLRLSLGLAGDSQGDGKRLLAVSQFFRLWNRNGYAENSRVPEGHCSPATAACPVPSPWSQGQSAALCRASSIAEQGHCHRVLRGRAVSRCQ